MKTTLIRNLIILSSLSLFNFLSAQFQYNIPHHYFGLFDSQRTSTRALGMGLTTVTLDGIETAFYNPASIGLTKEKLNTYIHCTSGSHVYKGGQFPFLGVSYRLTDKLVLGGSTYHWLDEEESVWTTIIGLYEEPVDGRRSQSMYNLMAAYEVIPNLNIGLSGNYIIDRSVGPGVKTHEKIILTLGAVYERETNWLKIKNISNQKLRVALSLQNALLENEVKQQFEEFMNFRDLPIYLHLGAAYFFDLPFNAPFGVNGNFFENATDKVALALHMQYRNDIDGPEYLNNTSINSNNNSFGIGAEAWFLNRFAFRMGYYNEKRPSGREPDGDVWVTANKRGFTWGFGALIPTHDLSKEKLPFNTEVNFVTSRLLNEYGNITTPPPYFTDRSFLFSFGVNLKFIDKVK